MAGLPTPAGPQQGLNRMQQRTFFLGAALIFGANYFNIWAETRPVTQK